jgi:hypothetical protein
LCAFTSAKARPVLGAKQAAALLDPAAPLNTVLSSIDRV